MHLTPVVTLLTLIPLAVVSINVLYYPFYYADTLSRYGLFARRIFETNGLPAAVQGYPLLVSLGYAWAFIAAGAVTDRLAGIVSAMFALATIGVTFVLGRELSGRRAGLAGAFLAATSTLFVVWGTSGYVDIPTGFYFALSALFGWRWLEGGVMRDAWLCGIAAGLAIWTKQAGLILVPSLAVVLVMNVLQVESRRRLLLKVRGQRSALAIGRDFSAWAYLKDSVRASLIILASIALVAGPWYLRNYLLSGPAGIVPLPGEFYAAQADHRLIALMPFATRPAEWGWPFAIAAGAGLLWGLAELALGESDRGGSRWRPAFVLAFIVPYHAAWWWAFSYETRFLLTLAPFYAALAGRLVDVSWRRVAGRTGNSALKSAAPAGRFYAPAAAAILCGVLTLWGVWPRLGAVYHLLQDPWASEHEVRLRLRLDQTLATDYLRAHLSPDSDSILLMDGSFEYFLTGYTTAVFYPVTLAEARDWDFLVLPGWAPEIYRSLGHDQSEFWQSLDDPAVFREEYRVPGDGGSTIYQILPQHSAASPRP